LLSDADLTPHIPTHNPCLLALHERLVETELDQLGQALVGAKVRTEIMGVLHRASRAVRTLPRACT
jgi:hypothetical protein